jgi:Cu+-exporting ATPase
MPSILLNEISLILDLVRERPIQRGPVSAAARRDPVCGMAIGAEPSGLTATFNDELYVFCSAACRARFLETPGRYAGT